MSIQLKICSKNLIPENQKSKKESTFKYHTQVLTSFGANTSGEILDCMNFISRNNYIVYPVGNTIIIRELSYNDNDKDKLASITHLSKQNNIFIHKLSPFNKKINSTAVSQDKSIFILNEELEEKNKIYSTISIYYLGKFNILNEKSIEPIRKIITDKYFNFTSLSLGKDNDYLCGICHELNSDNKKGIIYDLQIKKKFELNETLPVSLFSLENNVNKITYNRKIIGTSGLNVLNFFYLYEGKIKKIIHPIPKYKNFVDHCYLNKDKNITKKEEDKIKNLIFYIVLTESNEIYIIQGVEKSIDKLSLFSSGVKINSNLDTNLYRTDHLRIDTFIIRQYITNIFDNNYSLSRNLKLINQNNFCHCLIIGNADGDLAFFEKNKKVNWESDTKNLLIYKKIRIIHREIKSECTGISTNYDESMLCVAFKNSEISYCDLKTSFDIMKKNNSFNLKFHVLCEGYHHSPITSMNISSQRNILISSSNKDSSIKIWNYINGLSEYCSLIFTEETQENQQILKNFNILAMTLHPSGYYLALSNQIMIWFFFIYYKQLKFYGTEQISTSNKNVQNRVNCHVLKFSNGGKYLIAGNRDNNIFKIDSYTREVLDNYFIKNRAFINDIIFSDDDVYIYILFNNGLIYEINLDTGVNKLLIKQDNINFFNCFAFIDEQLIGGKNIKVYNLLICGKDILSEKYSLSEIAYTIELKKNDIDVNYSKLTYLNEKITSVVLIESDKLGTSCIVFGTLDGKIILIQSPINISEHKHKEIAIHKGKISNIIYSKETHLLFTSSDDGNIFILVIQEISGDEAFYESQINSIGQITNLLDVGLGVNVLMPVWDLKKIEKNKGIKDILEKKFEEEKKNILEKNENEIGNMIVDMKKKKEEELSNMYDKINELDLVIKKINQDNKESYNYIINEMNKKQEDENDLYLNASNEYENELNALKNELNTINKMYEEESNFIEREYKLKFFDLRRYFEKRTVLIKKENEKIEKNFLRIKEDKNVFITNLEVENEMDNKNILIEQDKINNNYKNHINKLNQEILDLKKRRIELEEILEEKEKDMNNLKSKVFHLETNTDNMKNQNNQISQENKNLHQKIIELKKIMENKKIMSEYENKLRKEIYKKNTEINSKYQELYKHYDERKKNNKLLERNINAVNTKALLIEEGKSKVNLALNVAQKENKVLKEKAAHLKNLFEEIIAKVYKSLQTINKNEVYKCGCELYKLFLTDEYKNTMKKKSLDMDIMHEFNIQIQGFEKRINLDKNYIKYLQDIQDKYKKKKIRENSSLLSSCTNITKKTVNLRKNVDSLNSEIKNLEETKINVSSISNNKIKKSFQSKSNSAKDIFPPITTASLSKNKGITYGSYGSYGSENTSNIINNDESKI